VETTYEYRPGVRLVLKASVVVFALCAVAFAVELALMLRHFVVHGPPENRSMWIVLAVLIGYLITMPKSIRGAIRQTRYSVAVSDDWLRIGDRTIAWSEIAGVEHPRRTLGLAFRVRLQDGGELDVYSGVERSHELEDLVRSRITNCNSQ
jgi:hypothetical protein